MQTIAVVDYGHGNLRSVTKALEHVVDLVAGKRQKVILTSDPEQVYQADRVVFPGQGAAGGCMAAIDEYGLRETILLSTEEKPFLGICMGLQVLVEHSEENHGTDCLGFLPGEVKYFGDYLQDENQQKLKVPHMGWNQVHQTRPHALWKGIPDHSRFYFVHSYFLETEADDLQVGSCIYGNEFTCAVARDNVFAIQCHPEKSADSGLQLLTNFVKWDGQT